MIVLVVAMAAAMAAAGGVALGAQQQEPRQGTSTPKDSSSVAPSSNVKPSAITDHAAIAWGSNRFGQLGNGTTTSQSTTPIGVSNLDQADITQVAGSYYHSLALESDGTVWAWGRNDNGQLGNGTTTDSPTPVQVDISGVTDIVAGDLYSLALKSDGTVWAWGSNYFGELGNGTIGDGTTDSYISPTPVQVDVLSGVTDIASGGDHSLALKSDGGTVWAWGRNEWGELGDGTTAESISTPVQVPNLSGVKDIAGGYTHSLALKSDGGTVWAWGNNLDGQLGNETTSVQSATPEQVPTLSGVTSIAAGGYHSLAIKEDTVANKKRSGRTNSIVMAWGENEWGQLGNGTTTDSNTPVQVSNLSGVKDIDGGDRHSLVLKSDGTVWAWGRNEYGQLGNGTTTDSPTPVQVPKLKRVADIDSGAHHNLAAK